MIRRALMLVVVGALAAALFYTSQFWYLSLWPRDGLLGIKALRPQGDLVSLWVRGTQATPFALLIWALGCFVVLSLAQKIYDRLCLMLDRTET
ncbi:hypothetical protein [Roseobacter sp.]|uniref:hypothetical protein n=1 Tax=Roseobacter sp. TaxID=1907202 RepID=UPI003298B109